MQRKSRRQASLADKAHYTPRHQKSKRCATVGFEKPAGFQPTWPNGTYETSSLCPPFVRSPHAVIKVEVGPPACSRAAGRASFCFPGVLFQGAAVSAGRDVNRWSPAMADLVDFVALSLLPPWCRLEAADGLRAGEPPVDALRRICDARWRDRPEEAAALRTRADAALCRGVERRLTAIAWSDAAYPIALTTIPDPPAVLWTRGQIGALDAPAVAVVGSRAASPYALAVAERLAYDLACAGLVVVSGLARGVDSAAHRGTLQAGGKT